jgi:hypothetical protein
MRRILAGAVILFGAAASAQAAVDAPSVADVLAANRTAVGAQKTAGSVRAEYRIEESGLVGKAQDRFDLGAGAFTHSEQAGPVSEAEGFDGRTPWQRDVSGVATPQEGGDRVPVAVNAAYLNANLWWRPDHGGAAIAYVGRETLDGRPADRLAVTPKGGKRFDAWFDAGTHLLVRTAEDRQFLHYTTSYSDYRPEQGPKVAHRIVIDPGQGPGAMETATLTSYAVGPAQPLSAYGLPTDRPKGGALVGGAPVTIPFRLLNNHVYVQGTINGKGPYTFIVDTGGHTLISPTAARAAGLHAVGEGTTSGAGDKTATTGFAHYDEIAVGGLRLTDQTAFVTKIYDKEIEGLPVDGMLGFEVFARFAVRLDYGARTMTLWPFERFDPKGAGTAVPFVFYDHLPNVRGRIDDIPARLDIDTGSRAEIDITSPTVARLNLRARYTPGISTITGWGVGGPSRSYVVRIPSLSLGSVTETSVVAGLSEAKGGSIADPNYEGNVGSGFLKRFVVTFDYSHQRMYLKPIVPPPADAGRFDRSGLWINAADDGFAVTAVAAASPAAEAGVAAGDVITAIDGTPSKPEGLSDARQKLRALPAGSKVALRVRRGGETRDVTVVLRDLI